MDNAQTIPIPQRNESYEHYVVRAHKEMLPFMPSAAERNEAIWDQWRKHRGETIGEQVAREKFGGPEYAHAPKVCVFREHDTINSEGEPVKYRLPAIVNILTHNNRRISEHESFAPLTRDHTSDEEGAPDPEMLGYEGPYHLGMVGRDEPKWAIFADEWHRREVSQDMKSLPFRSVELIKFKNTGEQFFHPIAALGAKAPRLSMPGRYSVGQFQGATVERYAVAAPSYPGGSNTFIQAGDDETRYSSEEETMQGNDELIAQIMDALAATPQFQFINQLMEKEQAEEQVEENYEAEGDETMNLPPTDDTPMPDNYEADEEETSDDMPAFMKKDDETEKNAAMNGFVTVDKYNAVLREVGASAKRIQILEKKDSDNRRLAKLSALRAKFGDLIDMKEEKETCLYSCGSSMSDKDFESHLKMIEKYAARAHDAAPVRIPTGEFPSETNQRVNTDKYAAIASRAVEICTEKQMKGEVADYEAIYAEVERQMS